MVSAVTLVTACLAHIRQITEIYSQITEILTNLSTGLLKHYSLLSCQILHQMYSFLCP